MGKSGSGGDPAGCGLCDTKGGFSTLTLHYDGDNLSVHNQPVPDKASIVPLTGVAFPVEANIRVYKDKNGGELIAEFTKSIGEKFSFKPENELKIEIRNPANLGVVLQTIRFHTSCSQPLEILDSFGGITIWAGVKK